MDNTNIQLTIEYLEMCHAFIYERISNIQYRLDNKDLGLLRGLLQEELESLIHQAADLRQLINNYERLNKHESS